MVMRLPASVHASLVKMLAGDDKASDTKTTDGLTVNESIRDR